MLYKVMHDIPGRLRLACCAGVLEDAEANGIGLVLRKIPGVSDAQIHPCNGSVLVLYDPGSLDARASALAALDGMSVLNLPEAEADSALDASYESSAFARQVVILTIKRLIRRWLLPSPAAAVLIAIDSLRFISKGLRALMCGRLSVEVLDATAITAAMLQGNYQSAGTIMYLLTISEIMSQHVNARTKIALQESLMVRADTVWAEDDEGREFEMAIGDVRIGQLLRVRTGASMPVDGTVLSGEGEVNEASMTGESSLVHKHLGSTVFAGTVVEDGNLLVRTDAIPGKSRIDRIVNMVEDSQNLKAETQSEAEHLADNLVPLSFIGFFAVLMITRNVLKAMSVLMVDYSCAIKLSTPVAIMSAMREASNDGIVIRGGKYLEALAKADVIVFDKTGTLTEASPVVERIIMTDVEDDENELLRIAACLEEHYPHSLARAIMRAASERGISHTEEGHGEVDYVVAHGIASTVDGKQVLLGSAHFVFGDNKVEKPAGLDERLVLEAPATSTVFMAIGGSLHAVLCISDPIRADAARVITALRSEGIRRVVMLTGDSEVCAQTISREVGIDEYRAQVLPEDKAAFIETLRASGHKVIMVGDGINDSPALASADVSVALRDASDIARAVADVSVQNAHLESLVTMRRLATRLMRRISSGYRIIVALNSTLIVLGVMGAIPPTAGAYLHNLGTVSITVANTRPLLKIRDRNS